MEWFRWYHGACSDSKWPVIARRAGVSVGVVVSVWAALLEHASQDEERGSVEDFDGETFDALYGYDDGTCDAVLKAMIEKKLICDGCIRAWQKRQPKREDDSAERVRRYREKKRQETAGNASVTPCNASVTPRNAQNREEQRREENNKNLPLPSCEEGRAAGEGVALTPRQKGTNPRALGTNPRAMGTNPRSLGTNPRAVAAAPEQPDAGDAEDDPPLTDPADMDMAFHEFLDAYPADHREPVGEAALVWKKLAREKALPGLPRLLQGLDAWEDSAQWRKDGGAYIPKAANFLRRAMWRSAPARASPGETWDAAAAMERLRAAARGAGPVEARP